MVTFEYRFDVLPGKLAAYEKYTKTTGKGVWLSFPGVQGVRVYKSMLGGASPQRVVQVDLDSLASLEKILTSAKFLKVKEAFHGLVTNVSDSLLVKIDEKTK